MGGWKDSPVLLLVLALTLTRPERLAERFESDDQARLQSGFAESSYKTIFDRIEEEGQDV